MAQGAEINLLGRAPVINTTVLHEDENIGFLTIKPKQSVGWTFRSTRILFQ